MRISWVLFRSDAPPKLQTLAKPFAPAIAPMGRGAGGEHHEHQLGAFAVRWPENHEHQLGAFPVRWPTQAPDACKHLRPSDCADGTKKREVSIMSISWLLFRPDGPPKLRWDEEAGGEHHEHQLAAFPVRWPPQAPDACKHLRPSDCADGTKREASIMSISWLLFWSDGSPQAPDACKNLRPSDCADGTKREASIMSISWLLFWSDRPPKLQTLANTFTPVTVQMGRSGRRAS